MKVKGEIKKLIYYNEKEEFVIIKIEDEKGNEYIAKGSCLELKAMDRPDAIEGMICAVEGKLEKHPRHGYQINAESIKIDVGMFFFLSRVVKGVGEKLAKEILSTYTEEELIHILENEPKKLLKVKGIGEKKLASIIEYWQKYSQIKKLSDFFVDHGLVLSNSLLVRIYEHFVEPDEDEIFVNGKLFNGEIIALIKENPYILTEVRGIGFKTADKIALKLGIPEDSIFRIEALIDYILISQAEDNGHTWLDFSVLKDLVYEEIGKVIDEKVLLDIVSNNPKYYFEDDKVGFKVFKDWEDAIEENLSWRVSNGSIFKISMKEALDFIAKKEKELGFKFDEDQRNALLRVMTEGNGVFILCGYAGTGKSTISKVILDFYREYFFDEDDIITCAFTGMASKRIGETTNYQSKTIHSLLGFSNGKFVHNHKNPLPYRVILIDEASMINLKMFYYLLRAIKDDAIVIMVGDDAQLPPIGEGNVFSDLLSKDWIPKAKLETIHRQSPDKKITYFASYVRKGELPPEIDVKRSFNSSDFIYIPRDIPNYWALREKLTESQLQDMKENLYQDMQMRLLQSIDEVVNSNNLTGLDKIWDIQVIVPMKKTMLGTDELNRVLQRHLNDQYLVKVEIKGHELRQFDKVIHLKNKNMRVIPYDKYAFLKSKHPLPIIYENAKKDVRVYNGSLGIVLDIDVKERMFSVYYQDPEGDKVVFYDFNDYKDLIDLGYALTIHKTQGNQFPYVFIPIINSFYIMLNNKLMYTAITRAKERVTIIGQPYAIKKSCTNIDSTTRNTWLSIQKENNPSPFLKL